MKRFSMIMSSSKNSNSSSSPPAPSNDNLLRTPVVKRRPSMASTVGSESPPDSLTSSPQSSSHFSSAKTMLTSPTSSTAIVGGTSGCTSLYPVVTDLSDDVAADCCGWDATEWMQSMLLMASRTDDSDIRVGVAVADVAANNEPTSASEEEQHEHEQERSRTLADELPPLPDISLSSNSRLQQRVATAGPAGTSPSCHRRMATSLTIASPPAQPLAGMKQSKSRTHRRAYSEGAATLLLAENGSGEGSEESAVSTTTLDRHRFEDLYVLTRPIFQCDRSAIWECVHRVSGQRYCVKIMDQSSKSANEAVMFQASQSHPSILNLVAILEDPSCRKIYLLTDLMPGGNLLSRVIQQGGQDEADVQLIASQLLQGIQHLHETACVTHNALHPANILLDTDDTIKIADFGAAEPIEYTYDHSTTALSSSSTASSSIQQSDSNTVNTGSVNTQRHRRASSISRNKVAANNCYCAPELLQPGAPTAASKEADMWSVGMILYFCLFGHEEEQSHVGTNHDNLTHATVVERIHMQQFPDEHRRDSWNATSRQARQFLASLLHMDPAVRLTADEALQHPWLADLQDNAAATKAAATSRRGRSRGRSSPRKIPNIRRSLSRFASYFKRDETMYTIPLVTTGSTDLSRNATS